MPIYDCECRRCGQTKEVITKSPLYDYVQCPYCGADMIVKISKPAAFIWKEGKPS